MPVSQYPAAASGDIPQILGYAEMTANHTSIAVGPETRLNGLAVTFTVPASRRIRVTTNVTMANSTADQVNYTGIQEGATILRYSLTHVRVAGNQYNIHNEWIGSPTAGTHTYYCTLNATGGTLAAYGDPDRRSFILVEDITGVAIPAPPSSVPVGLLAQAVKNTQQGSITSNTVISGWNINVVVPAGRTLKIHARSHMQNSVAGGAGLRILEDGAGVDSTAYSYSPTAASGFEVYATMITSPSAGSHTYTVQALPLQGGTVTQYATATYPAILWAEDITPTPALTSSSPSSTLAYAEVTTNQTGITSEVDLTGLTVTVTVPAGRRIRITGYCLAYNTTNSALTYLNIFEGGTRLARASVYHVTSNQEDFFLVQAVLSPSAGTHTYKLRMQAAAGTVVMYVTTPAFILVEDITGVAYNYTQPGLLPVNSSSRPSSPQTGAAIYEYDTGKTKIWSGAGWGDLVAGGSIMLAYAQVTSPQTIGTGNAVTDLTGLAVTVTLPAGRTIRITGHVAGQSANVGDRLVGYIMEGATYLGRYGQADVQQAGGYELMDGAAIVTPSAGTHTYKLAMQKYGGSGSTNTDSNTDRPGFIMVEDITGTTVPVDVLSVPVGTIGRAEYVQAATTALSSGVNDIPGLSVNVTVPAGRLLKVSMFACLSGGAPIETIITEDGTSLNRYYFGNITAGQITTHCWSVYTSPSAGMHTYKARSNLTQTGTLYADGNQYECYLVVEDVTSTPAPATTAPSSTLGYSEITTNQASITTETPLTGLSATVTVPAGRRLRIVGECYLQNNTVNVASNGRLFIKEGATYLQQCDVRMTAASVPEKFYVSRIVSPSAGSHTYSLTADNGGGGTATMVAGTGFPAYLLVEDVTGTGIAGHTHTELDDTGWFYPTFQNGWLDYSSGWVGARYRRKAGIVYIQGLIKSGTSGTTAFTLPVGFRPHASAILMNTSVSGEPWAVTRVDINGSNGNVAVTRPGDTWANLACSFPADA